MSESAELSFNVSKFMLALTFLLRIRAFVFSFELVAKTLLDGEQRGIQTMLRIFELAQRMKKTYIGIDAL